MYVCIGGCIYIEGGQANASIIITNTTFNGCIAAESGGCINIVEVVTDNDEEPGLSMVEMSGCTFMNGYVFDGGKGGLLYGETIQSLTITDSIFMHGLASDEAGCAFIEAGEYLTLSNTTFTKSTAYDSGCIHVEDWGSALLTDLVFDGCSSGGKGGAMRMKGPGILDRVKFINCSSGFHGGGLHLDLGFDFEEPVHIINSEFRGNNADYAGGIYLLIYLCET